MAAKRDVGDTLHEQFAAYLLTLLKNAIKYQEGDQTKFDLDAATMGVIRAFLKDNEIAFAPAEQGALDALRERFTAEAKAAAKSLVSEDTSDLPRGVLQ